MAQAGCRGRRWNARPAAWPDNSMLFYSGLSAMRITKRSPLQSSRSWPSTSCLAKTIASLSSAHVKARDAIKWPSLPTVYCPALVHFGDASPDDDSQSFMRDAASTCRALRIRPSRSTPGDICRCDYRPGTRRSCLAPSGSFLQNVGNNRSWCSISFCFLFCFGTPRNCGSGVSR